VGDGIPDHLRDKEFIFRNPSNIQVSEFHAMVMNHVRSIVPEGVEAKMIKDAANIEANLPPNSAFVVLNSVKAIMRQLSRPNPSRCFEDNRTLLRMNYSEDFNQVIHFQYSMPFTLEAGKNHAKKIDEQWMKTTILSVAEPFPFVLTRQLVTKRETRILCPIEVATQDIQERIDAMEMEVENTAKKTANINSLMMLVQGTVLPQVMASYMHRSTPYSPLLLSLTLYTIYSMTYISYTYYYIL
jgi:hypothetical protein